jgi:hypothetical protein
MHTRQVDITDSPLGFRGLTPEECQYLSEWRIVARAIGVDAVEDLGGRSWPCSIDGAVIGVFLTGQQAASWMVIKHDGQWAVAHCADMTVSRPVDSLAEALEVLCPFGTRLGAPQ